VQHVTRDTPEHVRALGFQHHAASHTDAATTAAAAVDVVRARPRRTSSTSASSSRTATSGRFLDQPPRAERGVEVPPYLPDTPEAREEMAEVQGAIAAMAEGFGRILAAIDERDDADDTWVVFTTDHGLAMPRAKATMYDAGIGVALIMRWPAAGLVGGRRSRRPGQPRRPGADRCSRASGSAPEGLHGRSYWPLLRGEATPTGALVFAEKTFHTAYEPMRAVRTERYKLIANLEVDIMNVPGDVLRSPITPQMIDEIVRERPPLELYDLLEDPRSATTASTTRRWPRGRRPEARAGGLDARTDDPILAGPVAVALPARSPGGARPRPEDARAVTSAQRVTRPHDAACRVDARVVIGPVYCDLVFGGLERLPDWGEERFARTLPGRRPAAAPSPRSRSHRLGHAWRWRRGGRRRARRVVRAASPPRASTDARCGATAAPTPVTAALSTAADRAFVTYLGPRRPPSTSPRCWRASGARTCTWPASPWRSPHPDVVDVAHARGATVSFDPGWDERALADPRVRRWRDAADVLLPNRLEAALLARAADDGRAPTPWRRSPARAEPPRAASPSSRTAPRAPGARWPAATSARGRPRGRARRPTGAGDVFDAGFLDAWWEGRPLEPRACAAARGAAPARRRRTAGATAAPTRSRAGGTAMKIAIIGGGSAYAPGLLQAFAAEARPSAAPSWR
jgi:sugar/nucleoside kinase (ribokinase family)